MESEKKFNWKRLLTLLTFVAVTGAAVGGTTYYVMGVQSKKSQEEADRQIKALEKQVQEVAKKDEVKEEKKTEDTKSDWKTYAGKDYSIKYPSDWLFKEYPASPNNLVAFVQKNMGFPPEQSDAAAPIMSSISDIDLANDITTDPSKIKKETIHVAGIVAKKWTLLPGRSNDMFGDQEQVFISVPFNGKYLWLRNYDPSYRGIFTEMASTVVVK